MIPRIAMPQLSLEGATSFESHRGLARARHRKQRLQCRPSTAAILLTACGCANARKYAHPLPQHIVPPARRAVSYRSPRFSFEWSKFLRTKPGDNEFDDEDEDGANQRRLRRLSAPHTVNLVKDSQGSNIGLVERYGGNEIGEPSWSLTVDASLRSQKSSSEVPKAGGKSHTTRRSLVRLLRMLDEEYDSIVGEEQPLGDDFAEGTVVANNQSLNDGEPADSGVQNTGITNNETTGSEWNLTTEIKYTETNSTQIDSSDKAMNATANADNDTSSEVYTMAGDPAKPTRFKPLRMRAILPDHVGNGAYLSMDELKVLFEDIISPSLLAWSSSLRVDPVVGNLTVDQKQLVDGETCGPGKESGLPSIQVPKLHMTQGLADTDMLIYLNLDFTNVTTAPESAKAPKNNRSSSISIGTAFQLGGSRESETVTSPGRRPSTDTCNGEYLAAASFCSTDQYDRPTAALLHICIDSDFFSLSSRNRTMMTVMHEIGHALGFNSLSMAHFRNPDGTPITPRNDDGSISDTEVECTGPSSERRRANVTLPSEKIIKFRNVRGGVRVAEVVTPSVVQVVRNQFDCQRLTGAELESGEPLPLATHAHEHACLGDHWERRLFSGDIMNPVIDELSGMSSMRISTLTLAYFADSGWYQVDLSEAGAAAGWGRGVGCDFVDNQCIGKSGQVPSHNEPFFCNQLPTIHEKPTVLDIQGCTPDLSRKAVCSIGQYDLVLPTEYQYFSDIYGSDVGGADTFMDYCPAFNGFANGLCSESKNERVIKASSLERFGKRNSRCVLGKLSTHLTALCMPIACVVEDRSLRIQVDGDWKMCVYNGQKIPLDDIFGNYVICPDPKRVCPTFFCPFDCLGTGGKCDYRSGECLCPHQFGGLLEWRQCEGFGGFSGRHISTGSILRPGKDDVVADSEMPHPDSPLSDYYVPTERSLRGDRGPFLPMWAWILCGGGVAVIVSGAAYYYWFYRQKQQSSAWFLRDVTDLPDAEGPSAIINRNKDKMIATILVDMRIQRSGDGHLRTMLPETTDGILTDSDVSALDTSLAMSVRTFSSGALSESVADEIVANEAVESDASDFPMQIRRRIIAGSPHDQI